MDQSITAALQVAHKALTQLLENKDTLDKIHGAGQLLTERLAADGRVFSCGNGGSMCDAMHFAEELSGRFRDSRAPLGALAISDPAHMSCTANDFGYDHVFSRFVEAQGRKGDVLLGISTSGSSANIKLACEAAKAKDMAVITLTGKANSEVGRLADIDIVTPADTRYSDRVQELHIKVIHILIEQVERRIFPQNYVDS